MILKTCNDVSQACRQLGTMHKPGRTQIASLNQHLTCFLCKGYYIDATTIIECLHSFCRSCIVKYLQMNKYCPVCDIQVHKTKPLLNIRPDKTLQDIVYKIVPGLFHNEKQRRHKYYMDNADSKPSQHEQKDEQVYQHLLSPNETICISFNYHGSPSSPRYLRCPASVSVMHLQKLIRAKHDLCDKHRIDVLYKQDCLETHFTLIDVACIYFWKRKNPLELTYRIYERTRKKLKLDNDKNAIVQTNNGWKEVQLQISENGEMSITGIQDCLDLLDEHCAQMDTTEIKQKETPTEPETPKEPPKLPPKSPAKPKKELPELKLIKHRRKSASEDKKQPEKEDKPEKQESMQLKIVSSPLPLPSTPSVDTKLPLVSVSESVLSKEGLKSAVSNSFAVSSVKTLSNVPISGPVATTVSKNSCNTPISTTRTFPSELNAPAKPFDDKKRKSDAGDANTDEPAKKIARTDTEPVKINGPSDIKPPNVEKSFATTVTVNRPGTPIAKWTSTVVKPPCYKPKPPPVLNVPKVSQPEQKKAQQQLTQVSRPCVAPPPMTYKTLKEPPKTWNPQLPPRKEQGPPITTPIDKNAKPAKFFKMRANNMPRYLGNPASGVKPLYKVHLSPEKPAAEVNKQQEIKKHSIVKIDPKTLKPISERAPDTSNLSNQQQSASDLKISTSSVPIFHPLKLQSGDRRSPKSPHSPNKKSSPMGGFTHTSPFIPNLASPTLDPNQFMFGAGQLPPTVTQGGGFPYDPRYIAAYHSYFMPRLPCVVPPPNFNGAQYVGTAHTQNKGVAAHKGGAKKAVKDVKGGEKSLQNAVEKLTQNKLKENKSDDCSTNKKVVGDAAMNKSEVIVIDDDPPPKNAVNKEKECQIKNENKTVDDTALTVKKEPKENNNSVDVVKKDDDDSKISKTNKENEVKIADVSKDMKPIISVVVESVKKENALSNDNNNTVSAVTDEKVMSKSDCKK